MTSTGCTPRTDLRWPAASYETAVRADGCQQTGPSAAGSRQTERSALDGDGLEVKRDVGLAAAGLVGAVVATGSNLLQDV